MAARAQGQQLEAELREMLAAHFPGITVAVDPTSRWKRPVVTFRWAGFAGLMAEERYERLLRSIPEVFRTERMSGLVWLELAEGESVDGFLKLPRSEDIAPREAEVYERLRKGGFFEKLKKALGRSPAKSCKSDYSDTVATLTAAKASPAEIDEAKLLFIRHGAYCDCQALLTVAPELAKAHADG